MIENISSWAKTIILAVIIVSILEMLLPNNKTKKYIKMIMGIFILYNIISPFVGKDLGQSKTFDLYENELEKYSENDKASLEVNQESMDKRIEELYIQEIEKDITKKVEKQGYIVKTCKVKAKFTGDEEDMGISKIVLKVEKNEIIEDESNDESDDEELEKKIVTEIQKIKKVDTKISNKKNEETSTKIEKQDIQNLKKYLIEEYEVSEKCLEIS